MNATPPPIDWMSLLVIAATLGVMVYLLRRMMRGMSQQDWLLLRQTRARGIDVKQPHAVDFVLFAATPDVAADLSTEVRHLGFEPSITEAQIQYTRSRNKPGTAQTGWVVKATRIVTLTPEMLIEQRQVLTKLATDRNASYLGWQIGFGGSTGNANSP